MLRVFWKIIFLLKNKFIKRSRLSIFSKYLNSKYISLGRQVTIGSGSVLFPIRSYAKEKFDARIEIEDSVYIGHQTQLHCIGHMKIGYGTVLSDYVYVSDVAHGLSPLKGPIMEQALESKGPVVIGRSCFVGYGVAILPGVELGDSCIISARAVVTRSFPSYSMLAGSPAKLIKKFDMESKQWIPV